MMLNGNDNIPIIPGKKTSRWYYFDALINYGNRLGIWLKNGNWYYMNNKGPTRSVVEDVLRRSKWYYMDDQYKLSNQQGDIRM